MSDVNKSEKKIPKHVLKRCVKPACTGVVVGAVIGMIPALGQPVAALMNYGITKETSKHPEEFGHGSPEGIVAAECANNACDGPTMIPLLTFGIPGDTITSVLLGAFIAQGLRPGPSLMTDHGGLVYGMLIAMCIGNLFLLAIGYSSIPLFSKLVKLPKSILYPVILVLCVVGAYAIKNSAFDVLTAVIFGVVGFFMKKWDIPTAPFVIAMLLGSTLEQNFVQSLLRSQGSLAGLVRSGLAIGCYVLALIVLIYLIIRNHNAKKKNRSTPDYEM